MVAGVRHLGADGQADADLGADAAAATDRALVHGGARARLGAA